MTSTTQFTDTQQLEGARRRCGYCYFRLPADVPSLPHDLPFRPENKPDELPWEVPRAQLLASQNRGCQTCERLLKVFSEWGDSHRGIRWQRGGFGGGFNGDRIEVFISLNNRPPLSYPLGIHPFVEYAQIPSGHTGSPETLGLLDTWISKCLNDHAQCRYQTPSNTSLPTRLLYIGTEDAPELKLVQTDPSMGSVLYACLSHRWNSETRSIALTTDRLDQFQIMIPDSSITPVFRDTIQLSRRLHLLYVWIDCFCIIQDSTSDWIQQAAMMGQIYEQSFITISALSCEGYPDDRLFHQGKSTLYDTRVLSQDEEATVYMRYISNGTHPYAASHQGKEILRDSRFPLTRRAWAYQERLLSPRVINFTRDEILWECRQSTWCECRSGEHRWEVFRSQVFKDLTSLSWHNIIENYSSLELSYESDRFPAISGIARRYAYDKDLTYFAGLWAETLVDDLTWSRLPVKRNRDPAGRPPPKICGMVTMPLSSGYNPPTWSWASVIGKVVFYEPKPGGRRTVEIVSKSITWENGDRFTNPPSATLVLKGHSVLGRLQVELATREIYTSLLEDAKTVTVTVTDYKIASFGETYHMCPDYDLADLGAGDPLSVDVQVFCVLCDEYTEIKEGAHGVGVVAQQKTVSGLVLYCTGDGSSSVYRRIGTFGYMRLVSHLDDGKVDDAFDNKGFWKNAKAMEFTIV
ncbi:heterokaryon incompatibility protein-domain-containing protein [Xylariaceae sp. FL0255]|nr:heterokaryon incompatibility protein-domain-containing protein [Xylariaceae sp. FL0255]